MLASKMIKILQKAVEKNGDLHVKFIAEDVCDQVSRLREPSRDITSGPDRGDSFAWLQHRISEKSPKEVIYIPTKKCEKIEGDR